VSGNKQVGGPPTRSVRSPYDRIRFAILNGTLAPGMQLVESVLAKWLGLSRTPVREALQRLEHDGLAARGSRGLIVAERSDVEVLDLYNVRIVLEEWVARCAVERHQPFDLHRLERAMRLCEEVGPTDLHKRITTSRHFHRVLWEAAHNHALFDLLERHCWKMSDLPSTTLSFPGRWREVLDEHAVLVNALRERDTDGAASLAHRHFSTARNIWST
jgi:DNA-binding GntR family transcriptional regulator